MVKITLNIWDFLLIGVLFFWVFCMGIGLQAEYNIQEQITKFPIEIAYIIAGIIMGITGTKIIDLYQKKIIK